MSATQQPAVNNPLSPAASSADWLPTVQVLDHSGQAILQVALTPDGLVVGRAPICPHGELPLILPDESLGSLVVAIQWDGFEVSVTLQLQADPAAAPAGNGPSGPPAEIAPFRLNGVPLVSGAAQPWPWYTLMAAGAHYLQLDPPIATLQLPASSAQLPARVGVPVGSLQAGGGPLATQFTVLPAPEPLAIVPGKPSALTVALEYLILPGQPQIAENIDIIIEGELSQCVAPAMHMLSFNPGDKAVCVFEVLVPATSEYQADWYLMHIHIRSSVGAGVEIRRQVRWQVLPFARSALGIRPKLRRGRTRAQYALDLRNAGNAPATYLLSGEDDEQALLLRFAQQDVVVQPGRREVIELEVQAQRWRWVGAPERRSFVIQAEAQPDPGQGGLSSAPAGEANPRPLLASFEQRPILPTWLIALVLIVLLFFSCTSYLYRELPATLLDRVFDGQRLYGILKPTATSFPALVLEPKTPTAPPASTPTLAPTPTFTPTLTPTATLAPTPTDTDTPTPVPTLAPISVCPPRFAPTFLEGRGGEPGELFVVFFDGRPVGGGSPQSDIVRPDGRYTALLLIGDEPDGFHTVEIKQGKRVLASFSCYLGATPTIAPRIVIEVPTPAR